MSGGGFSFDGTQFVLEAIRDDGTVIRTKLPLATAAQQTNGDALRTKAANALAANTTFLGLGSPTNAQTLAQVQSLTRQVNALIKISLGQLDDTAGT